MRQRFAFRRVGVTHALFSPGWVHAFARHLHNLEQQNAELRQRLAIEARHRLDQQVERAVPNYREIDQDPRWHQWLLSSDPLSGRQRQQLLNDAIASGATNRVISFFRQFLRAEGVAGQTSSPAYGRRAVEGKPWRLLRVARMRKETAPWGRSASRGSCTRV